MTSSLSSRAVTCAGALLTSLCLFTSSAFGAEPVTPRCALGDHPTIDAVEAKTAAGIVCNEIEHRDPDPNAHHEVRFGRLGGQTIVTLSGWTDGANANYDERRTAITNLEEVRVAGPRLADALTTKTNVEDTRTVDNVLTAESRPAKSQRGSFNIEGGLLGAMALGASTPATAGGGLDLGYRAGSIRVGLGGRGAGIGASDSKLAFGAVDVGGRFYFGDGDFAPFIGAGLGVSHMKLTRGNGTDADTELEGSGVVSFAQVGVEMLRTHHIAFTTSLRADAPGYQLEGRAPRARPQERLTEYVVPLSLNVGLVFQ